MSGPKQPTTPPASLVVYEVPVADLRPAEYNPRTMTENEANDLRASLREFGFVDPLVINTFPGRENVVIGGHRRLRIAIEMGMASVPVVAQSLDEPQERELNLRLNKNLGSWDWDLLATNFELPELVFAGFDAADLAFHFDAGKPAPLVGGGSPVFDGTSIVDAAFAHFKQVQGFPNVAIPLHSRMLEVNKLATRESDNLLRTITAHKVADAYHPHRLSCHANGMKSPVETFQNDKDFRGAIEMTLELSGTISNTYPNGLNFYHGTQPCGNFRPGFACWLYRRFTPQGGVVLDTSTGYGGRLVGALASGVVSKYIGVDPNTETHIGNTRLADELCKGRVDVCLVNKPVEDVSVDEVGGPGGCDFAFTSPPYFSKELYSLSGSQSHVKFPTGEAWRVGFLEPMMRVTHAALKPGGVLAINIANVKIKNREFPLVEWAVDAADGAGFVLRLRETYGIPRVPGAQVKDDIEDSEPLLVFDKH